MDPTGAEDPGNQAAPVCDTEVLKPLGKKSFRPSGGNALQAAFISLVELTLLFAERAGLHTGDSLDGKAPTRVPGTPGSMRIPCVVGVDFVSISLLSTLQNRLHSESLRKTDWLHEDAAATMKQYYTLRNCPQVILSTSREGCHSQNPVSEAGLDWRAGRHQASHEGTSACQPLC